MVLYHDGLYSSFQALQMVTITSWIASRSVTSQYMEHWSP